MSHDFSIRPITIAEQAMRAAARQVETGEPQHNPQVLGTEAHRRWEAGFARALQLHQQAEGCEGGRLMRLAPTSVVMAGWTLLAAFIGLVASFALVAVILGTPEVTEWPASARSARLVFALLGAAYCGFVFGCKTGRAA